MLGFCGMDKIQAPPLRLQRGHLQWNECHLVVEAGSFLGKRHHINKPRSGGSRVWGLVQKSFHLRDRAGYFSCWDGADDHRALAAALGGKVPSLCLCALLPCKALSTDHGHKGWCSAFHSRQGTITLKLGATQSSLLSGKSDFTSRSSSYGSEIRHRASLALSVV